MALSTSTNKVIHDGNGVATSFSFTFPILEASHLSVIHTDTGGNSITLSPSLYSVTGIGGLTGGSVTYPLSGPNLATGETLTILRQVPLTQTTVLSNQGGYYPEVVEGRFDRIYMALQQIQEETARVMKAPAADETGLDDLPIASARAGKFLAFNNDGQPIATIAEGSSASVMGFLQAGTGAIMRTVKDKLRDVLDVRDFGVVPGSEWLATTVNIQKAVDAVFAAGGGVVQFPAGTFLLGHNGTDSMLVSGVSTDVLYGLKLKSGVYIRGVGDATEFKLAPGQDLVTMMKAEVDAENFGVINACFNGDKDNQNFSGSLMGVRGANGNNNVYYGRLLLKNFCGRALEVNGDNGVLEAMTDPATEVWINKIRCHGNLTKNIHVRRADRAYVTECFVTTEAIPDNNGSPPPGTIPNSDNASAYEASGATNWVIDNNDVDHLTEDWGVGGRVVNGAMYGVISRLRSRGGRQGINIVDASHVEICHSRLEGNGAGGIIVQCIGQSATVSRNIRLIANTIINPTTHGISAGVTAPGTDLLDVVARDNYIYDDGTGVMTHGLRNNGVPNVTFYAQGNLVRGAVTADTSGTILPLGQHSGMWSPELSFSTSNGDLNVAYSTNVGNWWRIGSLIIGKVVLQTSTFSHSTASGDLRISGPPGLTVKNDANARGVGWGAYPRGITKAYFTQAALLAIQNSTTLGMQIGGSAQSTTNVAVGDMPSGGTVRIEMMFMFETSVSAP